MNELAYIISLTETLSNFVNTTETKSKKVFARLLFTLLIDGRLISRTFPLKQGEKNVYIASVKLLFEKYKFDSIERYTMQFLRDENPELMPGYEFILSSTNPNDLDENQIRRIKRSIQNTSTLKKKLILHFLFGKPYSPGLKDYELLTNLGLEIFGNHAEEIKTTLLEILSASHRVQRLHRNPQATNMYIALTPAIITAIENQNQDRRFLRLPQVLYDLQN
jgi:hypothetical protein